MWLYFYVLFIYTLRVYCAFGLFVSTIQKMIILSGFVSFRFNSCHVFLSFHPFVWVLLYSWPAYFSSSEFEFAESSGPKPCCFICVYPCFSMPNMLHLVVISVYCREMCRWEQVCPYCPLFFLLPTPSPQSPLSFPFRPLCSSIYLGCSGVIQTHWSWLRLCPCLSCSLKAE